MSKCLCVKASVCEDICFEIFSCLKVFVCQSLCGSLEKSPLIVAVCENFCSCKLLRISMIKSEEKN